MELPPNVCVPISDERCCIEGRTIFVAGEAGFLEEGETYYVTTLCDDVCNKGAVQSVYFYDEVLQEREYFTYLGVYDQDIQIFEYVSPVDQVCPHLVVDAECCPEVNFSRVNPLFYTKSLTVSGGVPIKQLFNTETISITSTYEQEFSLAEQVVVGPEETINVVQYDSGGFCTQAEFASGSTTTTTTTSVIINEYYEEVVIRGGTNPLEETFDSSKSVIATNTLEDTFKEDFTFKGVDLVSDSELVTFEDDLDRIRNINLDALEADRKRDFRDLPAQLIENDLIMLNIPFDERYDRLFEDGTRYLRKTVMGDLTTILVPEDGFLGVSAFKHNFVVFDPRPYITTQEGERPIFPGYDPIYNKKTYEEILEHIYTTVYPTNRVPAFPNFRIGDIAINGEIYNPMYDYRNFRLFGSYDFTNKNSSQDIFISEPLTSLDSRFILGRYIKLGSEYYRISRDVHNSGAKNTSTFGEVIQKVLPVSTKFEKVSKTVFDLNSAYHITL
jgi:hypothetical protein